MLFRLVHYLPVAHAALAWFSFAAAGWTMFTALFDKAPPGVEELMPHATVCRWLIVLYVALTGVLQFRLSRSGHSLISQPSRLWILFVAEQLLLVVLLAAVLVRGPTSRLYLGGLHHGVAALLIVALVSLSLAAVDRLVAHGVSWSLGDWSEVDRESNGDWLSALYIAVAAVLFLCIGLLEAQGLPNVPSGHRQAMLAARNEAG